MHQNAIGKVVLVGRNGQIDDPRLFRDTFNSDARHDSVAREQLAAKADIRSCNPPSTGGDQMLRRGLKACTAGMDYRDLRDRADPGHGAHF